jgi:hypothetical protein
MQHEIIPDLPELNPENYYQEDENLALKEFQNADQKLMIYVNDKGLASVFFKNLNHLFYAGLVVSLSRPTKPVSDLFDFLKLSLEGVRAEKLCTKKGHQNAVRIEKYLNQKTQGV